jgi:hypothetical protein
MSEEKPRRVVTTAGWWFGGVVTILAVYVLSVGPMGAIAFGKDPGVETPGWFRIIYAPILALANGNPSVAGIYLGYVGWWTRLFGGSWDS